MSNQKIRAAAIGSYYTCLPKPKEQSYAFCCFVLYFLHTNKSYLDKGWITTETLERATAGYLDRNKIGRIFGLLPHIPSRTRSSTSKKNVKKSYWKWDSKKIYDLLLSWGVEPIPLEELKNPKLTDNERSVGESLVYMFENWEIIFSDNNGNNKFNKNLVLHNIREMTSLTTKEIRNGMRRYKRIYKSIRDKFSSEYL